MDVTKTRAEYRRWAEDLMANVYAKIALQESKPTTHSRQKTPQGSGKAWVHLQPEVLNRVLCKTGRQLEMRLVCRAWSSAVAAGIHSLKTSTDSCNSINLCHLAKFPLRQLDLCSLLDEKVLDTLPELPQLASLHLSQCKFTTAAVSCLERLTALTALELTVSRACWLTESAMRALEGLPRLASLAVTCAFGHPFVARCMQDTLLQHISRLSSLTSLAMQLDVPLNAKQRHMRDAWMTRLRSLSLSLSSERCATNGSQVVHPDRLASMVPYLTQLENLHLIAGLWDATHAALVALGCRISLTTPVILGDEEPNFPSLHALTLCHSTTSYDYFIAPAVIPARYTNLRSLDVESPADFELLMGLSGLLSLTHLGLHEGLDFETMDAAYELPKRLTSFCFFWSGDHRPGAEQARLLKHVLQLPSLAYLHLGFGDERIEALEDGSWEMYGHLSALTASVTLHLQPEVEVGSLRCLTQIPNVRTFTGPIIGV